MLNIRKPGFWISLLGVIAIVCVAVCLATSPAERIPVPPPEAEKEAMVPAPETVGEFPSPAAVTVASPDEFLAAIASNTEIILEPGTYILSEASDYGNSASENYIWQDVYDGYQLIITNVENLTIRGSGSVVTVIETDPRHSEVIALANCSNVILEDFTAGHTRGRGECGGGVIALTACHNIAMNRLGLYGCGVIGLSADGCTEISLRDSDVYECSNSAVWLMQSYGVTVSNCRIYEIGSDEYGGYTFFDVSESSGIVIENNQLSDSSLNHMLTATASRVELKNNLFLDNRPRSSVFGGDGVCVTMDGNRFEGNSIRSWYSPQVTAQDQHGNLLPEEYLHELYGTGPKPVEPQEPQLEIHVSTADEFLAAIGPNKDIVLESWLYDLSTATGYGTSSGDYYRWEDIFDGPGLVIRNVSNMTIRTATGDRDKHTISAVPRYADVLQFQACDNITLSGFTAGHTKEPGSCAGGVLEFHDCDAITVENCGLFGCGILGVQMEYGADITVRDTEIYECSQGGISLWNVDGIAIENVSFRDIGGNDVIYMNQCKNASIDGNPVIGSREDGYMQTTAEQKEAGALNDVVNEFAAAWLCGELENIPWHLASGYASEPWTGGGEPFPLWFEATYSHVEQLRKAGSLVFEVPFRRTMDNINEEPLTLLVTVVEENGTFKVSGCEVK